MSANPVLQDLLEQGVPLTKDVTYKFPPPVLADGLDANAQKAAIEAAVKPAEANKKGKTFAELSVKKEDAPFVLKKAEIIPKTTAYRVDLYFIAHGDMSVMLEEGFFKDQMEAEVKEKPKDGPHDEAAFLTDEELAARNLSVADGPDRRESFLHSTSVVLDRVQVRGTSRAFQTQSDESLIVATTVAAMFNKDEQYPNEYQLIVKDKSGKLKLEPKKTPYSSGASFVKVTRLVEPAGALFIEFHMIYDEPKDWFNGKGILRSKFGDAARDRVPSFRRKLTSATEQAKKKG